MWKFKATWIEVDTSRTGEVIYFKASPREYWGYDKNLVMLICESLWIQTSLTRVLIDPLVLYRQTEAMASTKKFIKNRLFYVPSLWSVDTDTTRRRPGDTINALRIGYMETTI